MFASCCCAEGTAGDLTFKDGLVTAESALPSEEKKTEITVTTEKASDAPPAPDSTKARIIEVDLDVDKEDFCGITADVTCDVFPIVKEITGAAKAWNNGCIIGQEIKVFDRILQVEDEIATSDNLEQKLATKDKRKVKLTLKRPVETEVVLKKPGQLGITINYKASSTAIWVASMHEGLLQEWNSRNPDKRVAVNDRIIRVDGVKDGCRASVEKLRENADTVVLTVLTYS